MKLFGHAQTRVLIECFVTALCLHQHPIVCIQNMKKVSIVVLGDIGRSPRMEYHALSLAKEGFSVSLIGYDGSNILEELATHENVKITHIADCPNFKKYVAGTIAYMLKAIWQAFTLMYALLMSGIPDRVLVQNPPATPSLGVCYIFCLITRAQLIIDWHNYSHTILALSLNNEHSLVKATRQFEFTFGRRSHYNICVTKAMKENLFKEQQIEAVALHDRPPEFFRQVTLAEKHNLFLRLGKEYAIFTQNCSENETIFTKVSSDGVIELREDRPGLLISSTSWTEDEDFSILLDALQEYEHAKSENLTQLPRLILVVTGKGPLKEFYVEITKKRAWEHIHFITPWLSAEDYSKFLACGDLGVCLHYSSSGLDLPMKVVDMFGCGLPVCAINFQCIGELVQNKRNGLIFNNAAELSEQLLDWFRGFPESSMENTWRSQMKDNLNSYRTLRWHDNWVRTVKDLFI